MARMLRSIKSLLQTEEEFGAGAREWAAPSPGDAHAAVGRFGAVQLSAHAPLSALSALRGSAPGSVATALLPPAGEPQLANGAIGAETLRIAAAAQLAAYGNLGPNATGALNGLLSGGDWQSPVTVGSTDEFEPTLTWSFFNGYFTSGDAAAFAAVSAANHTLLISFRGSAGLGILSDFVDAAFNIEDQVRSLSVFIERCIDYARAANNQISNVIVTGHSLGGELAATFVSLYGGRLISDLGDGGQNIAAANINLLTFGSPGVPVDVSNIDTDGVGGTEPGPITLSLPTGVTHISFGNGEDPVFEHSGGLAILNELHRFADDQIVHVADNNAYEFEARPNENAIPNADEHRQALYYQIYSDLTGAGWYEQFGGSSIYALKTDAVPLYRPPVLGVVPPETFEPNDVFGASPAQVGTAVLGLAGDDFITRPAAQDGVMFVAGGQGNDTFLGGVGSDYVDGGGGTDTLSGRGGNDTLWGGAGGDYLEGGAGDDIIDGRGGGVDTAEFEGASTDYIFARDLSTGAYLISRGGETDQLFGVEYLHFEGNSVTGSINSFYVTAPTILPPPKPAVADDHGSTAGTATPITPGAQIAGIVGALGDRDWFAVQLQAGATYGFALVGSSIAGKSALAAPHLYLRTADGALISDGGLNSSVSALGFTPTVSDTYYLEARAHGDNSVGGYRLAVTPGATPPPPPTPPPPDAPPPSLDLDAVEPIGEEDGASLRFRVEYNGDLLGPIVIGWQVQGRGNHPTDGSDWVQTSGTVTLDVNRDYVYINLNATQDQIDEFDEGFLVTIGIVSGNATLADNDAGGTILDDDGGIQVDTSLGDHGNSFGDASPIATGAWTRAFIAPLGDVDYFAVTLGAGATYSFIVAGDDDLSRIGSTEGGFAELHEPLVALFDGAFNLITPSFPIEYWGEAIAEYEFTTLVAGTYYVVVRENGDNDIGQYFVRASVSIPADDYAGDATSTGNLAQGDLLHAVHEREGDDDWFHASLEAGTTYQFFTIIPWNEQPGSTALTWQPDQSTFVWPMGLGNPNAIQVRLFDADGTLVQPIPSGAFPLNQTNAFAFTPSVSGDYFFSVAPRASTSGDMGYLVGYEALKLPPGGMPIIVQPGSEGLDATFPTVRNVNTQALDTTSLQVGGQFTNDGNAAAGLSFQMTGLPTEAAYAAIEIYLHGTEYNGQTGLPPMPMMLGTPIAPWTENSTLAQIGDYRFETWLGAPTGLGWYRIDVTELYNAWQNGSLANNGIMLLPVQGTAAINLFHSSDYTGDPSLRPRLVVYARPPDAVDGTPGADMLFGTFRADVIRGFDGPDLLSGDDGDDFLNGGAGADMLNGGDGIDLVSYLGSPSNVSINLSENDSNGGWASGDSILNVEAVEGSDWADALIGAAGANSLYGRLGDDTLEGGAGADVIDGGSGMDTASYAAAPAEITVRLLTPGSNTGDALGDTLVAIENVRGSAFNDLISADGNDNTLWGEAGNDTLQGQDGNDMLVGGDGADTLDGGAGADAMFGGAGDDVLIVDNTADLVTAGEGNDLVESSVTYALSTEVERLILTGAGVIGGTGNALDNLISGNSAPNTLFGLAGADILEGLHGDDTLDGGAGADTLGGGAGIDTASYAGSAAGVTVNLTTGVHFGGDAQGDVLSGIENVLGSNSADFLSGDAGVNSLSGGAGADQMFGLAGNDTLDGGAGADQMFGGEGDDLYIVDNAADFAFEGNAAWGVDLVQATVSYTLGQNIDNLTLLGAALVGQGNGLANVITGNGSANTLFGFAGNDTLNGAGGVDQMFGGLGDDVYVVDNEADQTFEAQSTWGTDTAQASVTYQLGTNIDNLVLVAGAGALTGRGNILDNTIAGNESANTLFGFAGNDTLDGGLGADQLYGREGDDTYVVDNVGDVVAEANAAWGTDTIQASVTYFLAPNLENLTLTGAAAINGNGNGLANIMLGNSTANNLFGFAGADTLDGGLGADSLFGGEGDDLYIVDHAGDVGFEASAAWGTDLVQASVSHTLGTNLDNLTLTSVAAINGTGNGLANVITGNSGANTLFGLGGNDTLNGGAGADSLDGGLGDDAFVFAPGSGSDAVTGFIAGGAEDTINLSAYNGSGVTWTITQSGADTVFAFSNGDQITLTNVTAANLVQTDPFGYA